jgi:hypothetical protein
METTTASISWYVARRVGVPVDIAGPVLDGLADDGLRLRGTWGELAVAAAPVGLIRSRAAPHRRMCGRLHLPRRRAARVELELTPWSRDACELGLRPASLPRGTRGEAYLGAASAALDALGESVFAATGSEQADIAALERAS